MSSASVPVSPWIFQRAWRTRHAWEVVARYYQEWVVAVGRVTPHGVMVHGELVPWPSRRHQRLWRQFAWGVTQDRLDRLIMQDGVSAIVADDLPWRRLSLNFLGAIAYTPWAQWPDPAQSHLARVRWVPLYRRAMHNGRAGWAHPTIPAFFIPDAELLTPIIQRIPWASSESVGDWLYQAIDQWEQHDAPDAWFDRLEATHLTTERLMGMQFAMWTSMGLGYFDATQPLADWLTLWPPDPDWVLQFQDVVKGF